MAASDPETASSTRGLRLSASSLPVTKIVHAYHLQKMKKLMKISLSWYPPVQLGAREPDPLYVRPPSAFSVVPHPLNPGDVSYRSRLETPGAFLGQVTSREIVGAAAEKETASAPHPVRTTVSASSQQHPKEKVAFSSRPPVNASSCPPPEKAVVSFPPPAKTVFSALPLEMEKAAFFSLPPGTPKVDAFFQPKERRQLFSACPRPVTA